MKTAARFLIVFFLASTFYLLSSATVAYAQNVNTNITQNTNSAVPNNLHTWTQNVMIEVMSAMTCQLAGIDPVNPNQKCLGVDQKTGSIGFIENGGGAIGVMNKMIVMLYTPPLHTSDYFNYLSQNFGIVKPTYAENIASDQGGGINQGVGFRGLLPLINLWTVFRNVVYILFVIVFVLIGLAIMLRVHIDPRTVMTIENQIPKIIIGLFLVTFSFAIAGFLIDFMYVSTGIIYNVISDTKVADVTDIDPAKMQGENPFGAVGGLGGINQMVNSPAVSIKDLVNGMLGVTKFDQREEGKGILELTQTPPWIKINFAIFPTGSLMNWFYNFISIMVGGIGFAKLGAQAFTNVGSLPIIGSTGSSLAGAIAAFPVGYVATQAFLREFLPWLIAYLVIFIALLWALFRLWFELLKAYIFILIDVVFAPFWMLFSLLPGAPIGFTAWLRDMIANLSAFPVTITMFLLGKVFMDAFKHNNTTLFVPPLIGNPNDGNLIGNLIGIGIILMTPQVVIMMRDFLKAPQFKYTAGIGQALGVGTGVITGTTRETAGGIFVATQGALPRPGEKGIGALARRFFR